MFFQRGTPKLSKFMYNSFGAGSSGNLFNGTYAYYPLATNGNNRATDGTEINTRLSPKNADKDTGNLETVPDYQTFFTDSAALYEPSATNLISRSQDFTSGVWGKVNNVILTGGYEAPDGSNTATLVDISNSGANDGNLFYNAGAQSAGDYTLSVFLKAPQGQSGKWPVLVNIATEGNFEILCDLVDYEFRRFEVTANNVGGNIVIARAGIGTLSGATLFQAIMWQTDLVNASTASSPIYTNGSPTTRDSDKPTVPSSDAWVDDNVWLGNENTGGTTNGIRKGSGSTYFFYLSGTALGKYTGTVNGNVVGGMYSNNGVMLSVTGINTSSQLIMGLLTNHTEAEVRAAFENTGDSSNTFQVASQYSVYGDDNDLAGIKQLMADVGDYPPTVWPITIDNFSSGDATVTVNGNNILIDGVAPSATGLVLGDVTGQGFSSGGYVHINATCTGADLNELAFLGLTEGILQAGKHDYYVPVGGITPPMLGIPIISKTTSNVIDFDVSIDINKIEVLTWLDWPTQNFTTSFKFTPLALTGAGDAIIYVTDDANAQGYYFIVNDSNYNAFTFFIYNDPSSPLSLTIPIAGGIQIGTEYEIIGSVTDSTCYFTVNGASVNTPNTITYDAGNWNAKTPLAGSSEAVYTCKIDDLKCEDYQP